MEHLIRSWVAAALCAAALRAAEPAFRGQYYQGRGDTEYLELLDISRRMFAPDPEFQNVAMLYEPIWNGFAEGPTWRTTYSSWAPERLARPS